MGEVKFDAVDSCCHRTDGCIAEGSDDALDPRLIEFLGDLPAGVVGDCARADYLPAAVTRAELPRTLPGQWAGCFAPRMAELDTKGDRRRDDFCIANNVCHGAGSVIRIEANAAVTYPADAFHAGRFDDDHPRAGGGYPGEMDHVPIRHDTVIGAVLTHRCHHNAICNRQRADGERCK
jgi:hypothetical protein